jgi:nitronate monooxygenase
MADVSGGVLAAQVCRAGGLGFIAAGHFQDICKLEAEIKIFLDAMEEDVSCISSPCIGFIGHSSLSTSKGWENYEYIIEEYKPRAIQFFAPSIITRQNGLSNIEIAHKHGSKLIAQVGSIKQAREAIHHKADALICQGGEAGGHGLRRDLANSAMALSSQVSKLSDIPVIAAGGIVHGKHLAAALCFCDGVVLGTRLWASCESIGDKVLQRELIKDNSYDDVIKTSVFDQIENESREFKWPYPFDASGALRNQITEEWEERSREELSEALQSTDLLKRYHNAVKKSGAELATIYAGEGVGEIDSIDEAYEIILQIERDALDTIKRLQTIIDL